jgi:hypothetical protein
VEQKLIYTLEDLNPHKIYNMKKYFLIPFFIIFVILLYCLFIKDNIAEINNKYDLQKDGFIVIKNLLNDTEVKKIKKLCIADDYYNAKKTLIEDDKINRVILKTIGDENYMFQDYIWIIKKSSVHTCHRDNNGDFFNEGQQHPSYTMLIYLEDMNKCLGVIPTSHNSVNSFNVNLENSVVNLPCKNGDAILFNANLIHVGGLNDKEDNLRIQMKITHKDDIDTLSYYQNFNKVLNKDNNLPYVFRKIQKNFTCMLPIMSNLTQRENISSSRGSDNGAKIGIGQRIFSYLFYGNSKFYDLPNAF